MGLDTNTRPVVKAVEAYFEYNTTPEQMHLISKMLSTSNDAPDKLQQKFINYLSYSNTTRIKKLLDLLEYLTIFNTAHVPELINNEKFVENFSSAIMESDFQKGMLNLLRLWHDKYKNVQKDVNRIFELIENLGFFGIPFPSSYTSKYEGVEPESLYAITTYKEKEEEQARPPAINLQKAAPPTTDMNELFTKSKNVKQKALFLINDTEFRHKPMIYREETAQIIIEDLSDILIEFNHLLSCDYSVEIKDRIQDVIKDLNKLHGQIRQKLDEAEEGGAMEIEDNVYGPHLPKDKDYRRKDSGNDHFPTILQFDEFVSYKTEPCQEGNRCKFFSTQKKGSGAGGHNSELSCPYWHGLHDRRRAVCGESGNTLYNFTLCTHKENCPNGDKCEMSHNFVETFFHPLNYKKKRCATAGVCRTGKYCPYFHSQEEKGSWSNCLKQWFNIKDSEEDMSGFYGIDWGDSEIDWGNNDDKAHIRAISSHIPPHLLISNQAIPLPPADNSTAPPDKKKNEQPKDDSPQVASQLPLIKELHGKLTVRQEFVKPQEITGIFYNNPCFQHFPFVLTQGIPNQPNATQEK